MMLFVTSYIVQEYIKDTKEKKFCKDFPFSIYSNFDIVWKNFQLAHSDVTEGVGSDCTAIKNLAFLKEYKNKIILFLPHIYFTFNQNILYVDGWCAGLGSIVRNLVANYSLVVSCTYSSILGLMQTIDV